MALASTRLSFMIIVGINVMHESITLLSRFMFEPLWTVGGWPLLAMVGIVPGLLFIYLLTSDPGGCLASLMLIVVVGGSAVCGFYYGLIYGKIIYVWIGLVPVGLVLYIKDHSNK
jgi:hypothetical protein